MKLGTDVLWSWNRPTMPPLRTSSEIAEILGVTSQHLVWALQQEGAPQPRIRSSKAGHLTGRSRVWYEPREVIRWYREFEKARATP